MPCAASFVEVAPHRLGKGQDEFGDFGEVPAQARAVDRRLVEAVAERVMMGAEAIQLGLEIVQMREVADPDGAAADLVFIGRADAALGGADRSRLAGVLALRVEFAMQRQDQRDVLGDAQVFRADGNALALQPGHLVEEGLRIEHHAIADHGKLGGAQHA